jgi:hypothetical protein
MTHENDYSMFTKKNSFETEKKVEKVDNATKQIL